MSQLYEGSCVDIGILKKEFEIGKSWFKNHRVLVDLGFVGIENYYNIKDLIIGKKRPRKSNDVPRPELNKADKELNKKISQERIFCRACYW